MNSQVIFYFLEMAFLAGRADARQNSALGIIAFFCRNAASPRAKPARVIGIQRNRTR